MNAIHKTAHIILRIDSIAALLAGFSTITLGSLLTPFYGWPHGLYQFIGFANLMYGFYSGILAFLFWRNKVIPRWTVVILILANLGWALGCFSQAFWLSSTASVPGLVHLIFEGVFVGTLAYLEFRFVLPIAR